MPTPLPCAPAWNEHIPLSHDPPLVEQMIALLTQISPDEVIRQLETP